MEKMILLLDHEHNGHFQLLMDDHPAAELSVNIKDNVITAIHTSVSSELEGQGLGKKLLLQVVEYARKNNLKILPFCPFVHGQFRKHPGEYKDIWYKPVVH